MTVNVGSQSEELSRGYRKVAVSGSTHGIAEAMSNAVRPETPRKQRIVPKNTASDREQSGD